MFTNSRDTDLCYLFLLLSEVGHMKELEPQLTILDRHIMHKGILGLLGMQVPIPGVQIIIHVLKGEGTTQGIDTYYLFVK